MIVRGRYDLATDLSGIESDPFGRLKWVDVWTEGVAGNAGGGFYIEDKTTRQQRSPADELRHIALSTVANFGEGHLTLGDPHRAEECSAGFLIPWQGLIIVGHGASIIGIYYIFNSKLYEPANIFGLCH